MGKKQKFIVVIDTREKIPYRFDNSIRKKLPIGDYSIEGLEDQISIERKTVEDAYLTIGRGRKRFMRILEESKQYEYFAIVIEISLSNFIHRTTYSQLDPSSAINSLISWSLKYNAHIFFADSRSYGAALTYRILEKFYKYYG